MKNEEVKNKKEQEKKPTAKNSTSKNISKKKETTTTSKKEIKETPKKVQRKKETIEEEKVVEEIVIEEVEVKQTVEAKKKTKTSDIVLILGLVVVVVLGFLLMKGNPEEINYELPLALTGEVGLHQLTYQEYKEKVDNEEAFVLIIERATCSHCVNYMPVAENFASENNVPMYYVDTDTFSSEDWEGFEKSNSFLRKNSDSWGTPTTLVLVGSKALDYISGETDAESLKELYNEYFDLMQE